MSYWYRIRHTQQPATTVSKDLTGLGTPPAEPDPHDTPDLDTPDLDNMTKAELLEHGKQLGLDVKQAQSKDEIRATIDNA